MTKSFGFENDVESNELINKINKLDVGSLPQLTCSETCLDKGQIYIQLTSRDLKDYNRDEV